MIKVESWVFRVKQGEGESLGHYLGRFCRANYLSYKALGEHLGVRIEWVQAWESPSWRLNPSKLQLIALSKLVEVDPQRLAEMLPPTPLHLSTRLCAACYGETPVHRAKWQRAGQETCERHQLHLLSACPKCRTGFRTPALWDSDRCEHCDLTFRQMRSYEKPDQRRS
jgi:hypothetical protein